MLCLASSCGLPLIRRHQIGTRVGTVQGAVATWSLRYARLVEAPGRYRSLYRTDVAHCASNDSSDNNVVSNSAVLGAPCKSRAIEGARAGRLRQREISAAR